jgi:DNA-binding MarR family transcriptional regulator
MIRNVWIDPVLKQHGITSAQYTLLSVVKQNPGQSSADLSRQFFVTPQTMGPILTQLEKKGLILRKENPENRRLLSVEITEFGLEVLDFCNHYMDRMEKELFKGLDADELNSLRETLSKIYKKNKKN